MSLLHIDNLQHQQRSKIQCYETTTTTTTLITQAKKHCERASERVRASFIQNKTEWTLYYGIDFGIALFHLHCFRSVVGSVVGSVVCSFVPVNCIYVSRFLCVFRIAFFVHSFILHVNIRP